VTVLFGSMTGRVFAVLLLGMASAAALTQWLAVDERHRALAEFRDFHLLERAEQLIMTADLVPLGSRAAYLEVANRTGVRMELTDGALPAAAPGTDMSNALAARLGPSFHLFPLAERPAACARGQWKGACESMLVQMRDGHMLRLSLLPPRTPPGGSPHYLSKILIGFVICIALLAYLVTRMTMRPLKQMAQAATDLGNDINHSPLLLSGASEIRQAGAAFNAMQGRIREHIAQRTQMLAAITHDLQTPLTRMRLRLEKVADPELQERLVGDLSAMQQMVKEGLDLARSMDTTEAMQALDLDSLLDSVCADAVDAGQDVVLEGRAGMAVMGRPMALRRCLVNLIDNAVKYGKRAQVTVERSAGAARIRIRDAGPGIVPELLGKVFEPFYRIETSRSRESGGTGLGLTIARNIAEQHGASLLLANHHDGGLEVSLSMPAQRAAR
jgi:signal transduction histidine kinase